MKARIHRGASEIGGSCVELESRGKRLLIDAGLPLDLPLGKTPIAPTIDPNELCGIMISHPHLDHYGLLPQLPTVPVAMGFAARRIVLAAAPFLKQGTFALAGPDLQHRHPIGMGPFRITPFLVDHSAYDAYALLIEADGKRLFYSGDFRDHGRKGKLLDDLKANPPSAIDVLLMEGTTLGRSQDSAPSLREADLENDFVQCFEGARGLVLVQVSAQNIDRLVTIFRACLKSERTMVIDLYTALILEATGNSHIPQSHWERVALCIPERQRIQIKRKGLFDELARHSIHRIYPGRDIAKRPDQFVLLFRSLWMPDLERAKLLHGARLVHSQWEGYLTQPSYQGIHEWTRRHHLGFHQIHTSGHADPDLLRRFENALAPTILVPIHSDVPEAFAGLYPRVAARTNGERWEV